MRVLGGRLRLHQPSLLLGLSPTKAQESVLRHHLPQMRLYDLDVAIDAEELENEESAPLSVQPPSDYGRCALCESNHITRSLHYYSIQSI